MRIAIAGSGLLGTSLLTPLLNSSHEVVAILQDGRQTRGFRRVWIPALARWLGGRNSMTALARRNRLPIFWIDRMTEEELAPLRALKPDLILVGGFSIIFKTPLLDLPTHGCVNTHSSLLPRHRGPNPFNGVLMSGDEETGVTFHRMDPGVDTGDLLDQTRYPVEARDNLLTLYRRACKVASTRVLPVVDAIDADGCTPIPQDASLATYNKRPQAEDLWLRWDQPAEQIDRHVRALSPTPMARFNYKGRVVYVARSTYNPRPVEAAPGTVLSSRGPATIATGQGTITLRAAFLRLPIPWVWPAVWSRPAQGDKLD